MRLSYINEHNVHKTCGNVYTAYAWLRTYNLQSMHGTVCTTYNLTYTTHVYGNEVSVYVMCPCTTQQLLLLLLLVFCISCLVLVLSCFYLVLNASVAFHLGLCCFCPVIGFLSLFLFCFPCFIIIIIIIIIIIMCLANTTKTVHLSSDSVYFIAHGCCCPR